MAKYYIRVITKRGEFKGKSGELTVKEKEEIEELLSSVAKGKVDHLQIETIDDGIIFFPKKFSKCFLCENSYK